MPLDPQIFRDLDADRIREEPLPPLLDRLVYMGILLAPGQQIYSVKFPKVIQESYQRFAAQLNWRPWNKHLIRKEEARQARFRWLYFEVETIGYLGSPTGAALERNLLRLEDIARERWALLGWDIARSGPPTRLPRGPRRRRTS